MSEPICAVCGSRDVLGHRKPNDWSASFAPIQHEWQQPSDPQPPASTEVEGLRAALERLVEASEFYHCSMCGADGYRHLTDCPIVEARAALAAAPSQVPAEAKGRGLEYSKEPGTHYYDPLLGSGAATMTERNHNDALGKPQHVVLYGPTRWGRFRNRLRGIIGLEPLMEVHWSGPAADGNVLVGWDKNGHFVWIENDDDTA